MVGFTVLAVPVGIWSVGDLLDRRDWDPVVLLAVLVGVASRAAVPFLTTQGRSDRDHCGHGVLTVPGLALLPGGSFVVAATLGVGAGWLIRRVPGLTAAEAARRNSEIAVTLGRTTLAAATAAAVAGSSWWPAGTAVAPAMAGAVTFAAVDSLGTGVQTAVVEQQPLSTVLPRGVRTTVAIEAIAIACGLFVAMVVTMRGPVAVWILLAAAVALALAASVFATDMARARYQSLARLAAETDAARARADVEQVVVDTVAELVHAAHGELRSHPPSGDEIGVALHLPGPPTWLVMADRLGIARQFTSHDRELLRAAAPLASAAISDAIERAGMSSMLGTDALTGLANRRGLAERAPALLAHDHRTGRHTAVAVLDLDNFKPVNDELGHDAGDAVLSAVAAQLLASARQDDVVGRIGGDEFVVVAGGLPDVDTAELLVRRLRENLGRVTAPDGRTVHASLGVAVAPGDGNEIDTLLREADRRMYAEKQPRS